MRHLHLSMIALLGALSLNLGSGCFIEPGEPPAFRADCSSDGECKDGEACIASLCQVPCSTATFEEDCGGDGNYVTCFNGVCASTCDAEAESNPCPGAQECIGFDLSEFGASDIAICGQSCDAAGAPPCPEGETCLEGVCLDLSGGDTGTDAGTTGGY
jgi:hypothetical protein